MKANVRNNEVSGNVVSNLQPVDVRRANGRYNDLDVCENLNTDVQDATTTGGKKTTGEKETANGVDVSLSKNEIFAKLKEYFTPKDLLFDGSEIEKQMQPLVTSGVISQSVLIAAVEKARKEFELKNKETLLACENITFSDFLERLQANEQLYKDVLNACKLSEINESMVSDSEGNVVIYRGAQCTDKNGKARYIEDFCKVVDKLGKEHTATVYKELRTERTVTNYIQAIRYYSTFADVRAKLAKQAKECTAPLELAVKAIHKAMVAGFRLEEITAAVL